jgi:hypothetical protein
MPTLSDRRRDKVRLLADWQPSEQLAVQAALDAGRDEFSAPGVYGVRSAGLSQFTLDGNYAVSDKWRITGFASVGRQETNQGRPDAAFMAFRNHETGFGLGVTGKASNQLELGANLSYLQDRSTFAQTLDATASQADATLLAASGGLPPITFRQHVLRLTSRYTVDKKSAIRAEYEHYRTSWDDWAWGSNGTPFVFSDGTVGTRKSVQRVNLVRVVYTYFWQ